jgi:hypothetical protein
LVRSDANRPAVVIACYWSLSLSITITASPVQISGQLNAAYANFDQLTLSASDGADNISVLGTRPAPPS